MFREGRALAGTFGAFGAYASTVLPRIGRERERWLARAARIPDPVLREQALAALREKSTNVDATGVFATLAPRRNRAAVVCAGVALQIAVDYLDSLSEDAGADPLEDGLRLHQALSAAITPGASPDDPYRSHPRGEDGGYLAELIAACAVASATLPRIGECRGRLGAALARCGEGQAYTHAAAEGDPGPLRNWAKGLLPASPSYAWWEVAAGASSSVAAHALLALAADDRASATDAERVDVAYFPSIGALTVLLDDLVDFDEDAATREHNYLAYADDGQVFGERLGALADAARTAVAPLPRRGRHEAILAGVAGFYLAQPATRAPRWAATRRRLLESLGAPARVLTALSRLQGHARSG
jgi:tetraprenyl-beta-curcumene synthase